MQKGRFNHSISREVDGCLPTNSDSCSSYTCDLRFQRSEGAPDGLDDNDFSWSNHDPHFAESDAYLKASVDFS
jgi:hypothetical protein